MATIDLIVLGILKKEPMSAYDIQKLIEYRKISKWVKISTPSIYKKAIQLEEKDDRIKYFEFLRNTDNTGLAKWLKDLSSREEERMKKFGF